jgi:hypothetical protein
MSMKEPSLGSCSKSSSSPGNIDPYVINGLRRVEDWERLSRLEYVVEALAKEHTRQAEELNLVVATQRDMISNLKTIKFTVMGGLVGMLITSIGIEKTLYVIATVLGVG